MKIMCCLHTRQTLPTRNLTHSSNTDSGGSSTSGNSSKQTVNICFPKSVKTLDSTTVGIPREVVRSFSFPLLRGCEFKQCNRNR